MNRSLQIRGALCLVILLFSLYLLLPTFRAASFSAEERAAALNDPALKAKIDAADMKAIRRGLDLQGGMYLVLEIDITGMSPEQAQDARARVREILSNRVDQFGVSEPVIQSIGESRIIIQLPGLQDPERAKNLIGSTARLEFRLLKKPEDTQVAVNRLDEALRRLAETAPPDGGQAAAATDGSLAQDAAAAAGDLALTEGDSLQDPYGHLQTVDPLDHTHSAVSDSLRRQYPFSSYLVPTPWPYFAVLERDVPAVQRLLAAPEARVIGRDLEFQFGMEREMLQDGTVARMLYPLETTIALTGDRLTIARERPDQNRPGNWTVAFDMDRMGARQFAKLTGDNVGGFLAISLDSRVKSAPRINSRIPSGSGVIEGTFTTAQAADLALLLRAGALPADITIAEERTVGPSLGSDSIRQGVRAALYGSLLVILFMLVYYGWSGVISNIALISNIVIIMAVLAQFGLVLTLPGIAGIILTVGMAVDANVLINERIREELRRAKTVRAAVQAGYQNSTRTIVDANITTLIVGLVLWNFGTGPILGFAVTLCIGILTSMFTALVLTRVIMEYISRNKGHQKVSV
ncbi:MAG: protein translocase subunit SecD [Candidatus Krumholzibacteria bacterium]|jgi:protein-export membrane protein SecD|nr:protein translocase subunit SecD [Candidatus Krumholzibacteria bacterium]